MDTTYLAYHLDDIRRGKNVSVDDLCVGICTPRHYRRYLSGERELQLSKLSKFCESLGISFSEYLYSYDQKNKYIYRVLLDMYICLAENDIELYSKKRAIIYSKKSLDKYNKKFYEYLCILEKVIVNGVKNIGIENQLKKLIDYPKIISSTVLDFLEIAALLVISEIQVNRGVEEGLWKLLNILNNGLDIYVSSETRLIMPTIYLNTAIFMGRLGRDGDVLEIVDRGIDYCKKNSITRLIPRLRYTKSIALYNLGNIRDSNTERYFALITAISNGNITDFNLINNLSSKELGQSFKKDELVRVLHEYIAKNSTQI